MAYQDSEQEKNLRYKQAVEHMEIRPWKVWPRSFWQLTSISKKERGMDIETHEALDASIGKWEAIVNGTGIDKGENNCPLCKLFLHRSNHTDRCEECPVTVGACRNPEYVAWVKYFQHNTYYHGKAKRVIDKESHDLALAELEFLEGLREAEVFYRVGQRFVTDNRTYILAAVRIERVNFINLETGKCYCHSFKVQDPCKIMESEIHIPDGFILVE